MFDIGPTLSIPIFQGGRLTGQLRLREPQQREAALAFERTVLQAWREVDDALTAYAEAQRRRVDLAEVARQNAAALAAAWQRHTEGVTDFLNVITSQAQLLQSQTDLADSDTQIASTLVTLYRALGGGWQVADDAMASGAPGKGQGRVIAPAVPVDRGVDRGARRGDGPT